MCGFTGYINFNKKPLDFTVLRKMTDLQSHRGPDDQGFAGFSYIEKSKISPIDASDDVKEFHGGIGFNRLSIQDLSKNGHQPMISPCKNFLIAFNGEVYNAIDHKTILISKGYTFKGHSDTEVLLYLYMEYGIEGMLQRLNGMFAFAVVDLHSKKTYIARDHFGIKPLYIYRTSSTFMFSSEVKSFRAHPDFNAEINKDCLDEYLLFRYCANDGSLFKNVKQLPPSHFYEVSNHEIKLRKYWAPTVIEDKSLSFDQALEQLNLTLKNSIKSQLISDVNVGCQLSGGIDSSLVTTYAREFFNANMETFSIVFSDEKYSEEQWINYITELTQSDSHKYQYSDKYTFENFQSATWHLDQPISIPNTLGIKKLAEKSKQNCTVLLSGEGADELFGGYSRYHDLSVRYNNKINAYAAMPLLGKRFSRKYNTDYSLEEAFILSSSAMSPENFLKHSSSVDITKTLEQRIDLFPKEGSIIKRACLYDMRTYMVDLLNRQDKMTMAHSVENRVPFLDLKLVNLVLSLPSDYLVKSCKNASNFNSPSTYTKHILKKLAEKKFNKNFVYRKKSGFPLPIDELFFDTPMKDYISDSLLPGIKKRGLFSNSEVSRIWKKDRRNLSTNDLKNLWMFFSFETWAQMYLDN